MGIASTSSDLLGWLVLESATRTNLALLVDSLLVCYLSLLMFPLVAQCLCHALIVVLECPCLRVEIVHDTNPCDPFGTCSGHPSKNTQIHYTCSF